MTFLNPYFVLVFCPLVWIVFHVASGRFPLLAVATLPAASAIFLLLNDTRALWFLLASIILNYLWSMVINTRSRTSVRRALVGLGIVANLCPLIFFKLSNLSDIGLMSGRGPQEAIPLGMAFYTLQQITFLIDGAKAGTSPSGILRYCAWASLFCQLPAGPIAPFKAMLPQLLRLGIERPGTHTLACGVSLFIAGLFKKSVVVALIASQIDPLYTLGRQVVPTTPEVVMAAWGFLLQLYFDFSAYSDMAIGLALCFGLRLPVNFNSPLKATSFGDYVLRWHISMTLFVRDYFFLPVFRGLSGWLPRRASLIAWGGATVASFVVLGAWHSPAPAVLLLSLAVGCLAIMVQVRRSRRPAGSNRMGGLAWLWSRVLVRLPLLCFAAAVVMLYRSEGGESLLHFWQGLSGLTFRPVGGYDSGKLFGVVGAATAVVFLLPNTMEIFALLPQHRKGEARFWMWKASLPWACVLGLGLFIVLVFMSKPFTPMDFIYAQF